MTLRTGERKSGAARRLALEGTYPDEALYVGGAEALARARNLISSLTIEEAERYQRIRYQFYASVGNSKLCVPVIVENLGELVHLLILQPDVLRDVLTGSESADVSNFGPAFAIANNSANFTIQEAA